MQVTLRDRGKAVLLDVSGQVTFETVSGLREQMESAIKRADMAILVNLTKVTYLDSSGIAALVEGLKASQEARRAFGVYGMTRPVRNVVELVRLDQILNIFENEDEALRGLACPLPGSQDKAS